MVSSLAFIGVACLGGPERGGVGVLHSVKRGGSTWFNPLHIPFTYQLFLKWYVFWRRKPKIILSS